GWSAAIARYQQALGHPVLPWMVHSDPPEPGQAKPTWDPPPHALGGAASSLDAGAWLEELCKAGPVVTRGRASAQRVVFTSIATHHAPALKEAPVLPRDQCVGSPALSEAL